MLNVTVASDDNAICKWNIFRLMDTRHYTTHDECMGTSHGNDRHMPNTAKPHMIHTHGLAVCYRHID
jgi:hypothetical protein